MTSPVKSKTIKTIKIGTFMPVCRGFDELDDCPFFEEEFRKKFQQDCEKTKIGLIKAVNEYKFKSLSMINKANAILNFILKVIDYLDRFFSFFFPKKNIENWVYNGFIIVLSIFSSFLAAFGLICHKYGLFVCLICVFYTFQTFKSLVDLKLHNNKKE